MAVPAPAPLTTEEAERSASSRASEFAPGSSVAELVIPMMRIDHSGEVCAQALYLSQAVFARSEAIRGLMEGSGREEEEHLRLTRARLDELGAHTSFLNPVWFAGAAALGLAASAAGDRFSLAFLAETEVQVAQHLDGHIRRLPVEDATSRAILRTMRSDEIGHSSAATTSGGAELPSFLRGAMRAAAKLMTVAAARF